MKTLEEAQADLDAFLIDHPYLKDYQDKLEADMKDMTPTERMEHIAQCALGTTAYLESVLQTVKPVED